MCQYYSSSPLHPVGPTSEVGFPLNDRDKLDTALFWTFVQEKTFTKDGAVKFIEMYVGGPGPLRLGLYRPQGHDCKYKLIQQKEFSGLPNGKNKVIIINKMIIKFA